MSVSSEKDVSRACACSSYMAFLYAFLAGLCFSMNSVLVRFSKETPPIQMSLYRFAGMLLFSLPIAVFNGVNMLGPKGSRRLLLYRGSAAVGTVLCSFISFRYLPIGEASVIVFSTPVFVTIFARYFLKEECGFVQSFIVGLAILGIVFIINPVNIIQQNNHHTYDHTMGVAFGIAGLFCQCSMVILTRQTRNVHYSAVCVTTAGLGTLLCIVLIGSAYNLSLPGCGLKRWVAVAMGVSSSLGQIFYIKALQMENVGPISTLKASADITIAVTWQVAIFQETLDDFAISGTALVVLSVVLIGVRKWVLMLHKDSVAKKRLTILTY